MNDGIVVSKSYTAFSGPDATELYRANVLRGAIKLLKVGIKPSRGWTMTKALAACKRYTGRTYKRGEADDAIRDLTVWIETMKSAIPVEVKP